MFESQGSSSAAGGKAPKKVDDIATKKQEFEALRAEIAAILKGRKDLSELSEKERGVLRQKYSKIASVAREISKRSVSEEDNKKFGEFAEKLTKRAQELGLDAIHDTVHEMARDEARHGKAFEGLLKRYFN